MKSTGLRQQEVYPLLSRRSTAVCRMWFLWTERPGPTPAPSGSSAWLTRNWSLSWRKVSSTLACDYRESSSITFCGLCFGFICFMIVPAPGRNVKFGPLPVKLLESSLNGPRTNVAELLVKEELACFKDRCFFLMSYSSSPFHLFFFSLTLTFLSDLSRSLPVTRMIMTLSYGSPVRPQRRASIPRTRKRKSPRIRTRTMRSRWSFSPGSKPPFNSKT